MTIMVDEARVKKILNSGKYPDASGAYRQVYFLDNLVMKVSWDSESGNYSEYANYLHWKDRLPLDVYFNGIDFTIRMPEMKMIGDILFAERITLHNIDWSEVCGVMGREDCDHVGYSDCNVANAVDEYCETFMGISDMHTDNFFWDAETKTAWLVDIAGG